MQWTKRALGCVVLLLTACTGAQPPARDAGQSSASVPEPRTLVVVTRVEPESVGRSLGGSGGVGLQVTSRLFNAELALLDNEAVPRPYLAEALPALNTDTWRVTSDGKMETIYRLRPGLVWHDGTPLTAEDFLFGWQVVTWPALSALRDPVNAMQDVTAPDSLTLVIRWTRLHPDAGSLTSTFPALPKHILGASFAAGQADGFLNQPYWTSEFVGLGPYRLARWERGAFIEAAAFEGHALGRPKIERIKLIFKSDGNAALASLLSGDVQLAVDNGLPLRLVPTFLREWGAGRGTGILHPNQWRAAAVQFRPEYVGHRALLDPRVRAALASAIDKAGVNEAAYEGQSIQSDMMFPAISQVGRAVDAAIAKYPYDLRRAEQLMGQAGFSRGADSFYTSATDGRFTSEIKTNSATDFEAEATILASGWRQGGFDVSEAVLPVAQAQDNEARSTFPGLFSYNTGVGDGAALNYITSRIPGPQNRWTGGNRGGWSNPTYDRLADTYTGILDRAERTRVLTEMTRIFSEQLPAIALSFSPQPMVFTSDLSGPKLVAGESNMSWNIQEWEFH